LNHLIESALVSPDVIMHCANGFAGIHRLK
jgi:hypothetical protein